MGKLTEDDYDDSLSRSYVIKFYEDKFGIKLRSNPKKCKIDLLMIEDKYVGVEVEHGKWSGDFWSDNYYPYLSKYKFPTLNMPYRKYHYWLADDCGYLENVFVRHNLEGTQFIVVRSETIRDNRKIFFDNFKVSNGKKPEDWICFKREDVETYTLTNGIYILTR
jgi:hypothetical protein